MVSGIHLQEYFAKKSFFNNNSVMTTGGKTACVWNSVVAEWFGESFRHYWVPNVGILLSEVAHVVVFTIPQGAWAA